MSFEKQQLIDFEIEIKTMYEEGKIEAPVHLAGGNEDSLINIFKDIKNEDWVFSTHRSHYHALLKGVGEEWLKKEIIDKKSMHINSKNKKVFTSAIVGGSIPIALGVALALKLKNSPDKVWCFVGDMAAEMGVFNECTKYAKGFDLPIKFVIEDNGLSINTPTKKVWGEITPNENKIISYKYTRIYPHHGSGKWVTF